MWQHALPRRTEENAPQRCPGRGLDPLALPVVFQQAWSGASSGLGELPWPSTAQRGRVLAHLCRGGMVREPRPAVASRDHWLPETVIVANPGPYTRACAQNTPAAARCR